MRKRITIENENIAIEVAIDRLNASQGTIAKTKAVFANMGVDGGFCRSDFAAIGCREIRQNDFPKTDKSFGCVPCKKGPAGD